jgi:AbrB family looped-hinge helix DNA binding protein
MRVSTKGQVTIPVDVRERFGMLPNTEVEFIVDGGAVRLVVVEGTRGESRGQRVLRALRGSATVSMSTDEILSLTRGE